MIVHVFLLGLIGIQNSQSAADLAAAAKSYKEITALPYEEQVPRQQAHNKVVFDLIDADKLKLAEEFLTASNIIFDTGDYAGARTQYELTLTAATLGNAKAKEQLASKWEWLMMKMGRPRPFGALPNPDPAKVTDIFFVVPEVKSIASVWKDPLRKRDSQSDNAEIAKMFEQDQADRTGNLDQARIEKMVRDDAKRMDRTLQLYKSNKIQTANDMYAAAFLFQHGSSFFSFQTAHHLAVASMLLGNKDASWIAGASYDRMMHNGSYPQRFATQFSVFNNKLALQAYDASGINDTMRKAVVHKTLAEAKARTEMP